MYWDQHLSCVLSPQTLLSCLCCFRVWQNTSNIKWYVKVAQLCLTLCDPMDYILHGILQARILEWVAFPFSRGCPKPRDQTQVSCIGRADSLPTELSGKPLSGMREYIWPLSLDPCTVPGISWNLGGSLLCLRMDHGWSLLSFRMWECGLVTIKGQPHI